MLAGMLGLGIVWVNVGWITLVQRRTPAALLGRVDAALTVAITVPQVMSIALGAVLIAVVSYRVLLAVVVAAGGGYLAAGRDEQAVRRDEPTAVPTPAAAGGPVLARPVRPPAEQLRRAGNRVHHWSCRIWLPA